MADAIISVVVERVTAIIEEQIRNEVNLVRGVEKEVLNLSDELKTIRNVLDDAEKRGYKDKSIKDWLKKLEDTAYEMDDVLDEWNYAILKLKMERDQSNDDDVASPKQKVCSFIPSSSCLCFKKVAVRHDIAKKILNVKEQLDQVLKEKDRYNFVMSQPTTDSSPKSWRVQSTSSIELEKVQGRDIDRDHIVSKLMVNDDSFILSIVGVGGIGKTTLAQLVYNDSRIEKSFTLRIWICVSDPFDEIGIVKGIIESVRKESPSNTNQLEMLLQYLRDSISGKKFLLVLDDVWTEDYTKWEPLKSNLIKYGAPGSKVLVTTRNEGVAKVMGAINENDIYRPRQLSDEECWSLLRRISLSGRSEEECEKLEDIGKKIANKCKGLPLAANVLGSLLQFKNSLQEWENVLQNEIWQLEEAKVDLFPHLLLSYNELSPALKQCFSYCAVFPKDSEIEAEKLIGLWMALGYLGSNMEIMELKGWEYIQNLATRCLFQEIKKADLDERIISFKMHDIVHDFANYVRKGRSHRRVEEAGLVKKTTCQFCSPLLISQVKEYRSLFFGYDQAPSDFCDCLTSVRALDLAQCHKLKSIPRGMEKLIHLRWLDLSKHGWSKEEFKTICQLYNLQALLLSHCNLKEIPREIGNLIHLKHLDLSHNFFLMELPESICSLHELQTLNIDGCLSLCGLPEGIHRLINLKHLYNYHSHVEQFPRGLAQLTGLRTLSRFRGGSGCNKLGLLKNLNHLSRSLALDIRLTDDSKDVVEDAREAELREKIDIQHLKITFRDRLREKESCIKMDAIDALQPHPKLRNLIIENYEGSKFPGWITSPFNRLREIKFYDSAHLPSVPSLGKLPCLESIFFRGIDGLQFVGREFLGITTLTIGGGGDILDIQSSSSSVEAAGINNTIGFPKLKELKFAGCPNWKEWEDITVEEEESAGVTLMPCLTELTIACCNELTALPHRLLRKAPSLEVLKIYDSTQLRQRYGDKDGSAWKSIARNSPRLQIEIDDA